MYRIHFDPSVGQFVIQVVALALYWRTVRDRSGKIEFFETFEDAMARVDHIGLSRLYRNKSADKFRAYMAGDQRSAA